MTTFDDYLKKLGLNPKKLSPEHKDTLELGYIKLCEINGVDPQ